MREAFPRFSGGRVAISALPIGPERRGDPTPWLRLASSGATSIYGWQSVRSLDIDRTARCTAQRYHPRYRHLREGRARAGDRALPPAMTCTAVRSLRTRTVIGSWLLGWPNDRTTVQVVSAGNATCPTAPGGRAQSTSRLVSPLCTVAVQSPPSDRTTIKLAAHPLCPCQVRCFPCM